MSHRTTAPLGLPVLGLDVVELLQRPLYEGLRIRR